MKYIFLLLLSFSLGAESFSSLYLKNEITQGNLFLSKTDNYCQKKQYDRCINRMKEFLLIYSFHPDTINVYQKLSRIYKESGKVTESVEIDKKIYFRNPNSGNGLNAYLEAGKNLARMGKYAEAVDILEKLKKQNYSPAIARKAILELHLISIINRKN